MSLEKTIPNVVVDFDLEEGLLFFRIENASDYEASQIKISSNRNIYALQKRKTLNKLPIFNNLLYLPPRKEIKIFVDQIDSFFRYNKTPHYRFKINYKDVTGKQAFAKSIFHNLDIYKDLPIFFKTNSSKIHNDSETTKN